MVLRKNKARAHTGNLFANMDKRLRKKYNGTELVFFIIDNWFFVKTSHLHCNYIKASN